MHDNAIHDLALAYWSELLSPIKRAASLANRNSPGKDCDWLFFNRNICKHFDLVGGKPSIVSATSSSTVNQNATHHPARHTRLAVASTVGKGLGACDCYPLI